MLKMVRRKTTGSFGFLEMLIFNFNTIPTPAFQKASKYVECTRENLKVSQSSFLLRFY
jgi:hypothetical protein